MGRRRGGGRSRVLVSAHRCNDADAVRAALEAGADMVEIDVQRSPDGRVFVGHDAGDDPACAPALDDLLALVGNAGVWLQLDLKLGPELGTDEHVDVVRRAVEVVGAGRVVVTTRDDDAVRAVADWAREQAPACLVALTLGGDVEGVPVRQQVARRVTEVLPGRRLRSCGATAISAHWALAGLGASRAGLPMLVWTVDPPSLQRWWLRPERSWVVVTNRYVAALRRR